MKAEAGEPCQGEAALGEGGQQEVAGLEGGPTLVCWWCGEDSALCGSGSGRGVQQGWCSDRPQPHSMSDLYQGGARLRRAVACGGQQPL